MPTQDFTTPGSTSWTVPEVVNNIDYIRLVGGGGGGGSGSTGGGGGGGAWLEQDNISTSPGASWGLVVGAGGTGDSSDGTASSWNSGQYVAGGGAGAVGSSHGNGGTTSGSSPTSSSSGGDGGDGCNSSCTTCTNCVCSSYICTSYDPYWSCLGGSCNAYACNTTSGSSCDATGGGGGASGGTGGGGSCSNNGNDSCGYCTGTSCGDGSGGTATYSPGGNGGDGGSDGSAYGGGAGGGNKNGGDGIVRIVWTTGHLTITQQPTNTVFGQIITPAITVEVRYADNTLATGYTGNVNVAIFNNPASGTLSGTTTVAASGGIATFSNLSINNVGTGYTLQFTCSDADNAISDPFDITTANNYNETGTGGVVIGGEATVIFTPFATGGYEVYSYNRPAVESVFVLSNLRPSRAIR